MTIQVNYQYAHAKLNEQLKTNSFGLTLDNGETDKILRSGVLLEYFTYQTKVKNDKAVTESIMPVTYLIDDENDFYDKIIIPAGATIWFLKNKYYDMHNDEILVKFEDILYWEEN